MASKKKQMPRGLLDPESQAIEEAVAAAPQVPAALGALARGFYESNIEPLLSPVQTARGLLAAGKQFVRDPSGTAKAVAQAEGERLRQAGERPESAFEYYGGLLSPRVKFLLSNRLKERKLSIYWIMLREPGEPSIFSKEEYAEDRVPNSIVLHKYFQDLGLKYKAYEADNPETLQSAISDIDSREKKSIKYTETIAGYDYSRAFIIIAFILGLLILTIKNLTIKDGAHE